MDNPNYQQNQQPQYQQPQYGYVQQPASEAEKKAVIDSCGSVLMLVLAIVATVQAVVSIVGMILSAINTFKILHAVFVCLSAGDIGEAMELLAAMTTYSSGMVSGVFSILIAVGFWIAWANARKGVLKSNGISLIRIPYLISFIFYVINFVGTISSYIMVFTGYAYIPGINSKAMLIANMLFTILAFVFTCICFTSLNKTLKIARDINQNKSTSGRKAGIFAPIMLIVSSSLAFICAILTFNIFSIIAGIFTLAVAIVAAVLLLGFAKKIDAAHSNNF